MTAVEESADIDTDTNTDPVYPPVDAVTAHRSSPDRMVFTEEGNTDGWIATDLTVALSR